LSADNVKPSIAGAGVTKSVAIKSGSRGGATALKGTAENVGGVRHEGKLSGEKRS
jgi:hypothetical protein